MDKATFDKLTSALGFDGAMEMITSLKGGPVTRAKTSKPLAPKAEVDFLSGDFDNAEAVVTAALDRKAVVPFSLAYGVVFRDGTKFQSTRIQEVIAAFEAVQAGASAVITDSRGNHHRKVAVVHRAWLTARGYVKLPGCK